MPVGRRPRISSILVLVAALLGAPGVIAAPPIETRGVQEVEAWLAARGLALPDLVMAPSCESLDLTASSPPPPRRDLDAICETWYDAWLLDHAMRSITAGDHRWLEDAPPSLGWFALVEAGVTWDRFDAMGSGRLGVGGWDRPGLEWIPFSGGLANMANWGGPDENPDVVAAGIRESENSLARVVSTILRGVPEADYPAPASLSAFTAVAEATPIDADF